MVELKITQPCISSVLGVLAAFSNFNLMELLSSIRTMYQMDECPVLWWHHDQQKIWFWNTKITLTDTSESLSLKHDWMDGWRVIIHYNEPNVPDLDKVCHWIAFHKCWGTAGNDGVWLSLSSPNKSRVFLLLFFLPLTRQSIPYTLIPGTLA